MAWPDNLGTEEGSGKMSTYEVWTYTSTRDTKKIVEAENAIDAIRSVYFWKHASEFMVDHTTDGLVTASTQNGNGTSGAQAKLLKGAEK